MIIQLTSAKLSLARFGEALSERLGEGSHERHVSWLGKDEV